MKTLYLYIALAVLLGSEAFLLWNSQKQKKEIALKDRYAERLATAANTMETAFTSSARNAGAVLDGSVVASDTAGQGILLDSIVRAQKGSILICRFGEQMCHECVSHSISVIADSLEHLDKSRLLFLGQYSSRRELKVCFKEQNLYGCRVLNCPSLGIPADDAQFPYIMAVDSCLRVLSVYFPSKATHGSDYDYRHVKCMYDNLITD